MSFDLEWDEAKRHANIATHGIDVVRAIDVFAGPHIVLPGRETATESRWIAIGLTERLHVSLVFTRRGSSICVISIRKARHGERRQHQALHGGRNPGDA